MEEMEEVEAEAGSPMVLTLDVTLQGGAPWGLSVKGGSEHRCPLTIARIEPGGKASQSGVLNVDDIILSINSTECESHSEAVQLVKGSPNVLHLVIQRTGSDLHLRPAMKQTDYYKPPIQEPVGPHDLKKSQHIYDMQQTAPSLPHAHEKQAPPYESKRSPDYDHPPGPKPAPAVGGVTRRLKKGGEGSNHSRPKSWHNAEASQTWDEPGLNKSSQPPQAPSRPAPQQVPPSLPRHPQPVLPPPRCLGPAPSMDSVLIQPYASGKLAATMPRAYAKSMMSLDESREETAPPAGFVKRRVSDYISSSGGGFSKEKDFYLERQRSAGALPSKFRDVELQPAETYPKVAMATQLESAQQKAYIGLVPGAQTPPDAPQQQQAQTRSTSQVVSLSTVHMPERLYASTAELRTATGHPGYRASPATRETASPLPGDKREPPLPPQRGDSRSRTHQMSEHMKSSSWPVPIAETHESRRNDNNGTPSSVISPTDIPPVRLSPDPEQCRPHHAKTLSMTRESERYNGSHHHHHPRQSSESPPASRPHKVPLASETFPRMAAQKQEFVFTAQPCYVDPVSAEGADADTGSWFPGATTTTTTAAAATATSPERIPEKTHRATCEYQPRGSPPTRDGVEKMTEEKDPLVTALQNYVQTVLDHEECLKDINPEESSTGSESPMHQPYSASYFPAGVDYGRSQAQTLPAHLPRSESEKRLSRTSLSSLESHASSSGNNNNHNHNNHRRVRSPTSRLSSDEEEQNRKNSQLGSGNKRNWKSPNDFAAKKPAIDTNKKWADMVQIADPTWSEKYPHTDAGSSENQEPVRSAGQIDEKLIRGNAPGMRSPISPLMMEAVTTTIESSEQPPPPLPEAQQKEVKFLKTEGRDSGYEVESENHFRAQQDSPSHVHTVAETFTSEDLRKLDKVETGGTSILSQLQKETPFGQRYTVNGEQSIKATVNHETKVEISIDRPYSSNPTTADGGGGRPETSRPQSWTARPQPAVPSQQAKSREELKSPTNPTAKDARSALYGSQPQLRSGSELPSRHYHSSSLDLDTRVTGPPGVQASFPPWRPDGPAEEPAPSVSHTRSQSYSGFYPSYLGPVEPRFSRIEEEQGAESSESGPSAHPSGSSSSRQDRQSTGGGGSTAPPHSRSYEAKEQRRSTSDPKGSAEVPHRKSSFERGGGGGSKGPCGDLDYAGQHQYSKSDSERHRKYTAATDRCHKNSDPSGAIRKAHRVSDPEGKANIKDALRDFYHSRSGPQRSEGSLFGSQQGSLSDYASMQSLDQSSQYSSMTSLHGRRSGGGADSFDHSRQSSYSSNASHAHRDSGIVSPSESSWAPASSPSASPPGALDPRQRGQQRAPVVADHHQRAPSDSAAPADRISDAAVPRNSFAGPDDYRPGSKKPSKVSRSASMNQASRRRPIGNHGPRDRPFYREDPGKGLSRTETFSLGQRPSNPQNRPQSHLSATLPAGGYHDGGGYHDSRQHWPAKEGGRRSPTKAAPSVDRAAPGPRPFEDEMPPALPPKQVKEAHLKTIARVEERRPEESAPYHQPQDRGQERNDRRAPSSSQTAFSFPSPTPTDQQRYPSPKTSPTLPVRETSSPNADAGLRPRAKTSPSGPSVSPPRQPSAEIQRRSSASSHPKERLSPSSQPQPQPQPQPIVLAPHRPRADSFDLPPPPTPPAFVPVEGDLAELVSELPPPPPEVLGDLPRLQREERRIVEEPVRQRHSELTQSSSSPSPVRQEPSRGSVSPSSSSVSPPRPYAPRSPVTVTRERLPVSPDGGGLEPTVEARQECEDVFSPAASPSFDPRRRWDGQDQTDGESAEEAHQVPASPVAHHLPLDLEAKDEAGPIQVVEIVRSPVLSPKRGRGRPEDYDYDYAEASEEPDALYPLVEWALKAANHQNVAVRKLYKFPKQASKTEEEEEDEELGAGKMPREKKGGAVTPKRSECDVKSLTHALSSSLYLQISPAKALLLTKAKGMLGNDVVQGDSTELRKTKEELINRIGRKVSELRKEKVELQEEMDGIEDLGRLVTENVRGSCKESSLDKYLMYIGDADRVTKLLLSLSRRLTKVNSVLNSLEGNDGQEQKADLVKMHKDLAGKYEDAKGLKASIDARHVQISGTLRDHLSTEEHEDFCHFVRMRSCQRIMAQELDDRIALGEEQLQALRDSLKEGQRSTGEGSTSSLDSS